MTMDVPLPLAGGLGEGLSHRLSYTPSPLPLPQAGGEIS